MHTHFTQGTDLGLLLRTASHGFVNGGWGGAVDLGGYQRWWGGTSSGLMGSLVLGAPWGITLSVGAGVGNDEARTYTASLGVDLARLTVYRRSGMNWWDQSVPRLPARRRRHRRASLEDAVPHRPLLVVRSVFDPARRIEDARGAPVAVEARPGVARCSSSGETTPGLHHLGRERSHRGTLPAKRSCCGASRFPNTNGSSSAWQAPRAPPSAGDG